MNQDWQ